MKHAMEKVKEWQCWFGTAYLGEQDPDVIRALKEIEEAIILDEKCNDWKPTETHEPIEIYERNGIKYELVYGRCNDCAFVESECYKIDLSFLCGKHKHFEERGKK